MKMSQPNYFSDEEFATMIAAAAFAIKQEEKESPNHKKLFEGSGTSRSKAKSKREENMLKPTDSSKILILFGDNKEKEDEISAGERFQKKSTFDKEMMKETLSDHKQSEEAMFSGDSFVRKSTFDKETMEEPAFDRKQLEETTSAEDSSLKKASTFDKKIPEKTISDRKQLEEDMRMPSRIKKTPTFSDKYLNETTNKQYGGTQEEMKTGPIALSNIKPRASSTGKQKHGSMGSDIGETQADAWEKAEMDKTKKRYEKTNLTILQWEDMKKTKAKRRLERKESELDMRRVRASQEYCNEIVRIDKIAGGARALSDERRRKEESQILEKAKVIRATGKIPKKCFFF